MRIDTEQALRTALQTRVHELYAAEAVDAEADAVHRLAVRKVAECRAELAAIDDQDRHAASRKLTAWIGGELRHGLLPIDGQFREVDRREAARAVLTAAERGQVTAEAKMFQANTGVAAAQLAASRVAELILALYPELEHGTAAWSDARHALLLDPAAPIQSAAARPI